jgi:hypothetical protein
VDRQDVERIARTALKELGVNQTDRITVGPDVTPGDWRIEYDSGMGARRLRIKCGQGTTPQWVREQIFQQFLNQQ